LDDEVKPVSIWTCFATQLVSAFAGAAIADITAADRGVSTISALLGPSKGPSNLVITSSNQKPVLTIEANGHITLNPEIPQDEVVKAFVKALNLKGCTL
jgi:hypothetical protein